MALMLVGAALVIIAVGFYGFAEAVRDPIVKTSYFADEEWPLGQPDVRIVLAADLHIHGPTMTTTRLSRIVAQINALHPDVIVLAGDFVTSDSISTTDYSVAEAVAPLRSLRSKYPVLAVLGNHDRGDPESVTAALQRVGIDVLEDNVVELGPLAIAGVHRRLAPALRALRRSSGLKILIAHSPDAFRRLPATVPLMLAGHTHCGQIVLPLFGPINSGSRFGTRYMCGLVRESGKTLIVTSGLGTTRIPMRLGAPPDLWLITVGAPG